MDSDAISAICKILVSVLQEHCTLIMKQVSSDSLPKISLELFSLGLISETVKNSPTFEKIFSDFQTMIAHSKDVSSLAKQCQFFLNCLSSELKATDGQEAIKNVAIEWKERVKKNLDLSLPIEFAEFKSIETVVYHILSDQIPTIAELAELLSSLTKWQNFGMFLPDITNDIIEKIENDYKRTDRQKLALFSEWLQIYPSASWDNVIDALKKLKENSLVNAVQKHLGISPKYVTKELKVSSNNHVVKSIQDLHITFTSLMLNVRENIATIVETNEAKLIHIARFIEEKNEIKGLTKTNNVDELFNEISYCFLNCDVIVEMVDKFLAGSHAQSRLRDYVGNLKQLEMSAELQYIKMAVEEALLPKKEATESTCEVIIKLNGKWGQKTMYDFKRLIEYLFSGKRKLMNHIFVEEGSIRVRFLIPRCHSDMLVAMAKEKADLMDMEMLGIFEMYIDGHPIITEIENEEFLFELSFIQASRAGHIKLIKLLLELKVIIDFQEKEGQCTALLLASEGGHQDVVHTLVSAGANVGIQNENGWTALMTASHINFIGIVNELLQARADVNQQNDKGETALMLAACRGHVEIAKLLLEFKAAPFMVAGNAETAMTLAIQHNSMEIMDVLLTSFPGSYNYERLIIPACRYGKSKIILALLVKLPASTLSHEKSQLFTHCANGDQTSLANLISSCNVDVNDCFLVNGITPLMVGSACGHTEVVEVLLNNGADSNSTDNDGFTALVYSTLGEGSIQVFGKLVMSEGQVFFEKTIPTLQKLTYQVVERLQLATRGLKTVQNIQKLLSKFETVINQMKLVLESVLSAGDISTSGIIKHLQTHYDMDLKCTTTSTSELLAGLQNYYYILNIDVLEQIAVFTENELMQVELRNYATDLKVFEEETTIEEFKMAMNSGIFPSHILDVTLDVCRVVIKVNKQWKNKKVSCIRKFLVCSFSRSSSLFRLNKLESEGQACVYVFLISKSLVDKTVTMATKQLEYYCHAGCYEVTINGKPTLVKNQNEKFVFKVQNLPKIILKQGKNAFIDFILEMQLGDSFEITSSLIKAIEEGNNMLIRSLLCYQNEFVNSVNSEGKSLLMFASFFGHQSTVHLLLSSGANVNHQDNKGCTALMVACLNANRLTIIQKLVENGADINITDNNGDSAISILRMHGASANSQDRDLEAYLEALRFLLSQPDVHKNSMNKEGITTLMRASQNGQAEVVKLLLEYGADPNIQCMPAIDKASKPSLTGFTALLFATVNNHLGIVKLLLLNKADPNLKFKGTGETPLMATKNEAIIHTLLENGADPSILDNDGNSVIHLIINEQIEQKEDFLEILQIFILQPNANLNSMNNAGMTSLMLASQHGLVSSVELLLNGNVDVNVQCKPLVTSALNGYTALMFACVNCHLEIVRMLLQAKANADLKTFDGQLTALIIAICAREKQIVRLLLENNADPNTKNLVNGETAIYIAVSICFSASIDSSQLNIIIDDQSDDDSIREILQLLVSHPNIELNSMTVTGLTPLMNACQFGITSVVRLLLENGADPDVQIDNVSLETHKFTALMFACLNNKLEVVELLLGANANPNLLHRNGQTALMDAVNEGNLPIIQELLVNGADLSICDTYGNTAMHYSVISHSLKSPNHLQIVDLVTTSAVVNVANKTGLTGLMLACIIHDTEAVKIILSRKPEIDLQRQCTDPSDPLADFTALMYACDEGDLEIVQLLLQAQANPNIRQNVNKRGSTVIALSLAIERGDVDIVQQLLQYGANPNITVLNGLTAINLAVQCCHDVSYFEKGVEIVQVLLLQPLVNPNAADCFGFTCLISACQIQDAGKSKELVRILLQNGAHPNTPIDNLNYANIIEYIKTMDKLGKHRNTLQKIEKLGHSFNSLLKGFTALMIACMMGRLQLVKELLQAKADPNLQQEDSGNSILINTIEFGYYDIVQELLKNGADPNIANQNGARAIHFAVRLACTQDEEKYLKIIELLVEANADINAITGNDWSPLMLASALNSNRVIELLIKSKADLNATDTQGTTCLMLACKYGQTLISETLLNHQADSKVINNNQQTAFILAACSGDIDLVKMLFLKTEVSQKEIKKGLIQGCYNGHPNVINYLAEQIPQLSDTQKELLFTCIEGDFGLVVKQIVECQIDPNTSLVCGLTPLMVALSCGHIEIVDLLIQTGANVDQKETIYGMSSVYFARANIQLLDMLLENGADPNFIVNNQTLLDITSQRKQDIVSELLLKYGAQTFSQLEIAGLISQKSFISRPDETEASDEIQQPIFVAINVTLSFEEIVKLASTDSQQSLDALQFLCILHQSQSNTSARTMETKNIMPQLHSSSHTAAPILTAY